MTPDEISAIAYRQAANVLEQEMRWQLELQYRTPSKFEAVQHAYTAKRMHEVQGVVLGWAQSCERGSRGAG